ncbi:MAG: hypothetical protein ACOCRX_05770 [Candidatus Woesearchaeota archaeon]
MSDRYPSKKEIINTLLAEDPPSKRHNKLILLVEYKKLKTNFGIIKAELVSNGKIILKGSYTCDAVPSEDSFDWNKLKVGESICQGYTLDFKGQTIGSKIKAGFNSALSQGRIPFMLK